MHRDLDLPHLALTAGHCLLIPPKGKPDNVVALRFVSKKASGVMTFMAWKVASNRRWVNA